jgi:hypothetical protein
VLQHRELIVAGAAQLPAVYAYRSHCLIRKVTQGTASDEKLIVKVTATTALAERRTFWPSTSATKPRSMKLAAAKNLEHLSAHSARKSRVTGDGWLTFSAVKPQDLAPSSNFEHSSMGQTAGLG